MKTLFLALTCFYCTSFSFAQVLPDSIAAWEDYYFENEDGVYIKLGLNKAGVVGFGAEQSELGRANGFSFAIGGVHSLHPSERIWLTGELGIGVQGFRFKNAAYTTDPEEIKLDYLNLPIIVRYYPLPHIKFLYVGAGPHVGYLIGEKLKTKAGGEFMLKGGNFNKIDVAGVVVAGGNIGRLANLGLEVRYQHGFNKFFELVPNGRQSVWQFNVYFPAKVLEKISNLFPGFFFPF